MAEAGFYVWFRDALGFGPLQGDPEERPRLKGLILGLARGLDKLALRAVQVRDEMSVYWCADQRVEAHAQERGIDRLAGESDDQFRAAVKEAYKYHQVVGRDAGFRRAIRRATAKPFQIQYFGREGWRIGQAGFGLVGCNASGLRFAALVTFLDHLSTEELAQVQASVTSHGQAMRDVVYYVVPDLPRGVWRHGQPGFGLCVLGPLWFDLGGHRYALGESVLAGATASAQSEATGYPLANLFDLNYGSLWRSTAAAAWLKADLGQALAVAQVALLDHNLTSGATVTLEGNAADSWGAPAYSQAIPWTAGHLLAAVGQTYRFWRLTLTDPANPAGYLQAGEFHLGVVAQKL